MADTKNNLPEGTDTVIAGGGVTSDSSLGRSGTSSQGGNSSGVGNATGGRTSVTSGDQTDALITGGTSTGTTSAGSSGGDGNQSGDDGSSGSGGVRGLVSTATTKVKEEAGTRTRSFLGQGLQTGGTTLSNVASLVEDTVEQIGERLGPQYADYARTASEKLNQYAATLQNKDPDELVDDAREIIRKSPGVALGAAAIVGFSLARLIKVGFPEEGSSATSNRNRDRAE